MADNTNNNFDSQEGQTVVSPDQMSLFQNPTPAITHLDIPHQALSEDDTAIEPEVAETSDTDTEEVADEVSGSKKIKIIAALAIVVAAGYIANWVQEPVQIKADVIGTDEISDISMPPVADEDTETMSSNDLVTANTALDKSSSPSVNVDVSLFGFEPATLKLDKGTTVIWTNTSTEDQTIVGSSEDGQSFVSPVLASGDSFDYQFDQNATFQYYSTYNPALKASIIVGLGVLSTDNTMSTTATSEKPLDSPTVSSAIPITTAPPSSGTALEEAIAQTQNSASVAEGVSTDMDSTEDDILKPSADSPTKLAKTGPEDFLYLLLVLAIGWFNRKALLKAFNRY